MDGSGSQNKQFLYAHSDGNTLSSDKKQILEKKEKIIYKDQMDRLYPPARRTKPVPRWIKPVHLVLIFSLNWPLVFSICPFFHVFSCPTRENSTIMIKPLHQARESSLVPLSLLTFQFLQKT